MQRQAILERNFPASLDRDERALISLAGRLANNVNELLLVLCQPANAKQTFEP
jgi:hypothetical protein